MELQRTEPMRHLNELILVLHTVHDDIDEDVARAVLPSSAIVRGCVKVLPARLSLEGTRDADWIALAHAQRRIWERDVVALREKYPGAGIAYFGLAPIPLAVHLGSLTESWPAVQVFQRGHDAAQSWHYVGGNGPQVLGPDSPKELVRSLDPVLLAISVTNAVDIDAARSAVGPTSAEIFVQTDALGSDILVTHDDVVSVADRFRDALDLVERNRPGAAEVHLFAAIPCGLAFLLGARITPTRDTNVVTYQYHRGLEPRLLEALRVPERAIQSTSLSAEERARSKELRESWEGQRSSLIAFLRAANAPSWWMLLGQFGSPLSHGQLGALEAALDTPLTCSIDIAQNDVDGFRFDSQQRVWLLSDELLRAIDRYVATAEIDRAGRMLLLHEALHHGQQNLTFNSATQIRLAPKVLEELDYRADVSAMLHEFAFEGLLVRPWPEQRLGLLGIIDTALTTMWAFDDDRERGFLEVRRISRYLIWYMMLARIERATTIVEGLQVLAEKPTVDLVGPVARVRDGRLVAKLDGQSGGVHELVLLDQRGNLRRIGTTNAVSVAGLAVALGRHEGGTVRAMVRGINEQLGS
jgi:hypothetical protein